MGIGDWGLGIGDWGLGFGYWVLATPQSPIPNPHRSVYWSIFLYFYYKFIFNKIFILINLYSLNLII